MSDLQKIFVHVIHGRDRSFYDDVAICYILPVLWMTTCLHIIDHCGSMLIPLQRMTPLRHRAQVNALVVSYWLRRVA